MIGNIKWNIVFGAAGMLLTFFLSWSNNPFSTSFIRSIYCFVILFLVMFVPRFILGSIAGLGSADDPGGEGEDHEKPDVGNHVDIRTPEEDDSVRKVLDENQKNRNTADEQTKTKASERDFSPLQPPKLASKDKVKAEKLADAVRQMSEEEGR